MTDWKFRVDLDLYDLGIAVAQGTLGEIEYARKVADNIEERLLGHPMFETVNNDDDDLYKIQDIIQELRTVEDSAHAEEEIDGWTEELYDWADSSGVWLGE